MRNLLAAFGSLIALTACGSASTTPAVSGSGVSISDPGEPLVYVAIGASDTVGIGSDNPISETWPQLLYVQALPRASTFYNVGVPGATTADAARTQLPRAIGLHANIVTILLGVNDLISGVDASSFEANLDRLIASLRDSAHARVLVADLPVLDSLPAVALCVGPGDQSRCLAGPAGPRPHTRAALDGLVAAYNAAIKRVAAQRGATLVDLAGLGDYVAGNPQVVSGDGFHPSDEGYRIIAREFVRALRSGGRSSTAHG